RSPACERPATASTAGWRLRDECRAPEPPGPVGSVGAPLEPRIVYLATYPPRRCGIASFTHDLRAAVGGDGRVFALDPADGSAPEHAGIEPPEVMAFLGGHTPADYRRAAIAIDGAGADIVSLQHEYGIYGGPDGEHVLAFADRLQAPIVPTLHTILTQ